ncbi:WD40-repeat-containing domain protein [Mycena metata]|uniref:WD40-repeat-containing domain protein n=1 Tax=Mycena metata TaxID=1033252 RepID=A0AAD7NMW9_9AGAR|nr:WD40-repeat-containing domain protein [Mycena metata]
MGMDRIERLTEVLVEVSHNAKLMSSRGIFKRILTYNRDEQWLRQRIQTMSWSIRNFTAETTLSLEFALHEHARYVQHATEVTHDIVGATYKAVQKLTIDQGIRDGHPSHASKAAFNSVEREACSNSTREEVLSQIFEWIHGDSEQTPSRFDSQSAKVNSQVFWINGPAGTGKTTIAYTIAKKCKDSNVDLLGASFFCSRDDTECSDPCIIFPTISYQLGIFNPLFGAEVSKVLSAKPDIIYASVHYQLQELLVKPLAQVRDSFQCCIIILDALDECKDEKTISVVLSTLSHHMAELYPLKFLVTSRPESHIVLGFANTTLHHTTRRMVLHELKPSMVEHDIQVYLTSRLSVTKALYRVPGSWPSLESIRALVQLSAGLFVFAATSVKFIEDPFYSNPRDQLNLLLGNTTQVTGKSSPFERLDQLYTEILQRAHPNMFDQYRRELKTVLGCLLCVRNPISSLGLEKLLNLDKGRVREILLHLHSVVIVPDDDNQDIRLLHPSFFDFLTNPTRCLIPDFTVRPEQQHTVLALSCLCAMDELTRDPCHIGRPWLLNSEVVDLPQRITTYIPAHIRYATRHWAHHISASVLADIILDALKHFCTVHLLHWIELCSLLGELRHGLNSISYLRQVLLTSTHVDRETLTLLHDAEHIMQQFFPAISASALQVYHSALLFAPDGALIVEKFKQEMDLQVKTYNAAGQKWSLSDTVIDTEGSVFQALAFSPSGTQIVTGSHDGHVRLWDALSGVHLQTLDTIMSSITSVTFTSDGTGVIAGSSDGQIRLWDAHTGKKVWCYTGQSKPVECVAVSATGYIASGSQDTTIQLWDPERVSQITLEGHLAAVLSIAFSNSGTCIVSGSADQTVRIWHHTSFMTSKILRRYPEWVLSVAFSPDDSCIAAGCSDQGIWICDSSSGRNVRVLRGHNGRVVSVVFSSDGRYILSGSRDHTVRLWDIVSGAPILNLCGHSAWVTSIALSPTGTRVASGSEDRTLRIWDISDSTSFQVFKDSKIRNFILSPDGTHVASVLHGSVINIWDASHTGTRTLRGYCHYPAFLQFSSDNRFLVSLSENHLNLKVWTYEGDRHPYKLQGHAKWVTVIAFDPSSSHIASGSDDTTIRLWNTKTWMHVKTLHGHSDTVSHLAFSRDGSHITSRSLDNTIGVWDFESSMLLHRVHTNNPGSPSVLMERMALTEQSAPHQHYPKAKFCMMDNGWICRSTDGRRICWLPVALRPKAAIYMLQPGICITFEAKGGKQIIIDFSAYLPTFRVQQSI